MSPLPTTTSLVEEAQRHDRMNDGFGMTMPCCTEEELNTTLHGNSPGPPAIFDSVVNCNSNVGVSPKTYETDFTASLFESCNSDDIIRLGEEVGWVLGCDDD